MPVHCQEKIGLSLWGKSTLSLSSLKTLYELSSPGVNGQQHSSLRGNLFTHPSIFYANQGSRQNMLVGFERYVDLSQQIKCEDRLPKLLYNWTCKTLMDKLKRSTVLTTKCVRAPQSASGHDTDHSAGQMWTNRMICARSKARVTKLGFPFGLPTPIPNLWPATFTNTRRLR